MGFFPGATGGIRWGIARRLAFSQVVNLAARSGPQSPVEERATIEDGIPQGLKPTFIRGDLRPATQKVPRGRALTHFYRYYEFSRSL